MQWRHLLAWPWIVLGSMLPTHSKAQDQLVRFNEVKGVNGVPVGKIVGITQDKAGYIWLADQTYGVTRYDGARMITFTNKPEDPYSLFSNSVECIAADSSGNVWIGTSDHQNSALDKYDPRTGRFNHFISTRQSLPGALRGLVICLLVDHLGRLWAGTTEGLFRYDEKKNLFVRYAHDPTNPRSLSNNHVRKIYEDRQGRIWVGTGVPFDESIEGGLNLFDERTEKFTRYLHDPKDPQSLVNNKVRAIFEDHKGQFWVGTKGDGLHLMNRETGTFQRLPALPAHSHQPSRPPINAENGYDHITFITEDAKGLLWVGSFSNGIAVFDPSDSTKHYYSAELSRTLGFKDSTSWCSFQSREGVLWIATENAYLYRVDPLLTGMVFHPMPYTVWSLYQQPDGLVRAGSPGNGLYTLQVSPDAPFSYKETIAANRLGNNAGLNDVSQTDAEGLWLANWSGLKYYSLHSDRLTDVPMTGAKNPFPRLLTIVKDPVKNQLYLLGIGFYVFHPETGKAEEIKLPHLDVSSHVADTIITGELDQQGNLWIGTLKHGIVHWDAGNGRSKLYLGRETIYSVVVGLDGTVWAGSESGVYMKSTTDSTFHRFHFIQDLLNKSSVGALSKDAKGNIWGACGEGIFRIDGQTRQVSLFGKTAGITNILSRQKTEMIRLADGRMILGKYDGVYIFQPQELVNTVPPTILVSAVKVQASNSSTDEEINIKVDLDSVILLPHNSNIFRIEFGVVHFSDPAQNVVEYILEGYEKRWHTAGEGMEANYINVSPGSYTFRLRATSSYGKMAEKHFRVTVLPPWWQTTWAYILYALASLLLLRQFIRWRTASLQKARDAMALKVAERTRELKEEKEVVEQTLGQLKATQNQLVHAEKMASLGQLTAGIAHEIQNPLNFVNNFSEISTNILDDVQAEISAGDMVNAKADMDQLRQNLEKINHHGKRADSIVKAMLQHSRASAGTIEKVQINELVQEYIKLAYHGMRAKDTGFHAEIGQVLDSNAGVVDLNAQEIGRVLLNILTNALYAVQERKSQSSAGYHPKVMVETRKAGDHVEITIEDNGSGIPENIIQKIFQPFFTTKPTGVGTGLGLSLSYDIIKAHGGTIDVQSEENKGTRFLIRLPATSVIMGQHKDNPAQQP